jgi:hypothetical protein
MQNLKPQLMKKFQFLMMPLLYIGAISLLMMSGCKEDEDPAREKYLGVYTVVETCGSGNDSYEIVITESGSNENAIVIANVYNFGVSASATVDGNSLNIASQNFGVATLSGTGQLNGNILTLNFVVSVAGAGNDNCTATCTRK